MCDADINVITYRWFADSEYPFADFNVEHKCRDFEAVKRWVYERRAAVVGGRVRKPEGVVGSVD